MRARIDGAVALVSGASSGIGEAIARELAPRVKTLILVARRRDRLEDLAAELRAASKDLVVVVEQCDLCDRADVDRMLTSIAGHGTVDLLVNNAGFGDVGIFELSDWDKVERMLELNVRALTYLTHRLVGPMVAQGRGGILLVSSGFGLTFLPGFAAYIGTKHYVTGFAESLRLELASAGVVVTQLCPGPVATEFEQVAGNPIGSRPQRFVEISAERCARAALRGFERGRAIVIPGAAMKLMMAMAASTPRFVMRLVYRPVAGWLRRRQLAGRDTRELPA
jgi:uncharacterized protein